MLMPCVYNVRGHAEHVADRIRREMNELGSLSIGYVYEIIRDYEWPEDIRVKPKWLGEPESSFVNFKRGWLNENFHVYIGFDRWCGGSGYLLELPDPIDFA